MHVIIPTTIISFCFQILYSSTSDSNSISKTENSFISCSHLLFIRTTQDKKEHNIAQHSNQEIKQNQNQKTKQKKGKKKQLKRKFEKIKGEKILEKGEEKKS